MVAQNVKPSRYGAPLVVVDLQAYAACALGNAYRVSEDFRNAERLIAEAFFLASKGSGDLSLRALLFETKAALAGSQRRFGDALRDFHSAWCIYTTVGERQSASKVLVAAGLYAGYGGHPNFSVILQRKALSTLNEHLEPMHYLAAIHNIAWFLTECGRWREASAILQRNKRRYARHAGPPALLRRRWLQARISAELGQLDQAECFFVAVRSGFKAAGQRFDYALTAFDLAAVLLRQGRRDLAYDAIQEAGEIFVALGIAREALASFSVLMKAVDADSAKSVLAQYLLDHL